MSCAALQTLAIFAVLHNNKNIFLMQNFSKEEFDFSEIDQINIELKTETTLFFFKN